MITATPPVVDKAKTTNLNNVIPILSYEPLSMERE
jgi:hypothetical protein